MVATSEITGDEGDKSNDEPNELDCGNCVGFCVELSYDFKDKSASAAARVALL